MSKRTALCGVSLTEGVSVSDIGLLAHAPGRPRGSARHAFRPHPTGGQALLKKHSSRENERS